DARRPAVVRRVPAVHPGHPDPPRTAGRRPDREQRDHGDRLGRRYRGAVLPVGQEAVPASDAGQVTCAAAAAAEPGCRTYAGKACAGRTCSPNVVPVRNRWAGWMASAAARDAARGRLLALGAGLLATSALVVTARSRARSRAGQLVGRYALALEQL